MIFQGSKNRLAKDLLPIIHKYIEENNIDKYIELFVGGANLIDKVQCNRKIGCDINDRLIKLLTYVRDNPDIPIAPNECTFEHYSDVRSNQFTGKYSDEYVALIGYSASYGGRYYAGGYGRDSKGRRNIYDERIKNLKKQAPNLKYIEFYSMDYKEFDTSKYPNALYYMDIPYFKTKEYDKNKFDYEEFYNYCRELSKTNIVLISEYYMPDDFTCIWQKERKILNRSDRTKGNIAVEKLFTIGKGLELYKGIIC